MGSAASSGEMPGAELTLPATGLQFSASQLRCLNDYVDKLYEDDQKGRMSIETEYSVETLVQRLVDGAGQRDPRFRCAHMIALHRGKKMRSRSLEYLITLDGLQALDAGGCALQDGPVGYGKIRLEGPDADRWAEFMTPTGFLCRDKVVERWVELLARCAAARGGGASRALCARAHAHAQPYTYCYLERVSATQQCTERRLAIVEGGAWVMVRAGDAEAKLMLGARMAGCSAAAYTTRVPLTHPLALLHYTSAQTGYYAVAAGPPSSIVCGERAATWQLWHPALEASLDAHHSELSTVAKITGALNCLVDRMREGSYQGSLQLLSRYACWCAAARLLLRAARLRLPARGQSSKTYLLPLLFRRPQGSLQLLSRYACWCAAARRLLRAARLRLPARALPAPHRAHHLLLILDDLVQVCERNSVAGFVYPVGRASLTRRGARGSHWAGDAAAIRACLLELQARADASEPSPPSPSEALEAALLGKWEAVCREGGGAAGAGSYTRRQLHYLRRLLLELVACKDAAPHQEQHTMFRMNLLQATSLHQESLECLIHLLAIMLDQARDMYLVNVNATVGDFDKELSNYRSKKWNKLRDYYDASSALLIDAVRRDSDTRREDLSDNINLMKNVLSWLYKGAKEDKKYLSPVLKPFLDELYTSSQENCWFLEEFDARKCGSEFRGLREYCMGVHNGGIEPCMGLMEASKKYAWAKVMVDIVDRYRHIEFRLIFPTGGGLAVSYGARVRAARALSLSRRDRAAAKLRLARRAIAAAFHDALVGTRYHQKHISHGNTDEILASVKLGNYWRNSTKPDVIPPPEDVPRRRRSRRSRPLTVDGFPEISITSQSDTKTMRKKYHTLKNLVYTEPVENIKELKERPRSAGSTLRKKEALSRPSILETLDFINTVKDSLCVSESGTSDTEEAASAVGAAGAGGAGCGWGAADEWVLAQVSPLNLVAARAGAHALTHTGADLLEALMARGKFTVLQELCGWLACGAREAALFALYRLARAARARSADRHNTWRLPEPDEELTPQRYRARAPDELSGDEAPPQPPPLPRHVPPASPIQQRSYAKSDKTALDQNCTGIISPLPVKLPRDKFTVKRTKSLGRSFSTNINLDISKYTTISRRRNDVVTAITGTSGETGLDVRNGRNGRNGVGEYRLSRITID